MASELHMPTLRDLWQRWGRHHDTPSRSPSRRRQLPPMASTPPVMHSDPSPIQPIVAASWAEVQQAVRRWPSGMPVTSDLLAQVFGVGRGQAWRWLERLERAGLVTITEDPPNAQGVRRKRRWVV